MILEMTEDSGAGTVDLSVFERARRGDADAFDLLMRTHERRVLRVAIRLVGQLHDAQDISQDVFMKLYRELRRFEDAPDLASWLYRVTVNACWDHERRKKRSPLIPMEIGLALRSGSPSPEKIALQSQDFDLMLSGLATLSQGERAALVLREMEGLSTAEVASIPKSAEVTVRVQISTARAKLRKYLEAKERNPV